MEGIYDKIRKCYGDIDGWVESHIDGTCFQDGEKFCFDGGYAIVRYGNHGKYNDKGTFLEVSLDGHSPATLDLTMQFSVLNPDRTIEDKWKIYTLENLVAPLEAWPGVKTRLLQKQEEERRKVAKPLKIIDNFEV